MIVPSKVDDVVLVALHESAYLEQLELCKYSLIARVVFSKRDKLWPLLDLKAKMYYFWV